MKIILFKNTGVKQCGLYPNFSQLEKFHEKDCFFKLKK